jgi:hypothetical protein
VVPDRNHDAIFRHLDGGFEQLGPGQTTVTLWSPGAPCKIQQYRTPATPHGRLAL